MEGIAVCGVCLRIGTIEEFNYIGADAYPPSSTLKSLVESNGLQRLHFRCPSCRSGDIWFQPKAVPVPIVWPKVDSESITYIGKTNDYVCDNIFDKYNDNEKDKVEEKKEEKPKRKRGRPKKKESERKTKKSTKKEKVEKVEKNDDFVDDDVVNDILDNVDEGLNRVPPRPPATEVSIKCDRCEKVFKVKQSMAKSMEGSGRCPDCMRMLGI